MPSFTVAPLIIGLILGLAVLGFFVAVFLRLAAEWVVKIEIPIGKAFGLAIAITLLNGVLGFIIRAWLSGGHIGFIFCVFNPNMSLVTVTFLTCPRESQEFHSSQD
ncbi:MAG TPA: hypothetical protein P5186_29365 [Candidatus Paceibacterota bacterium]|nr:hypothetical protein [Verrucomicrobiota bacterium]HRY52157.1 hypothetical protein [Candidatus Paceibacterota bacterium]